MWIIIIIKKHLPSVLLRLFLCVTDAHTWGPTVQWVLQCQLAEHLWGPRSVINVSFLCAQPLQWLPDVFSLASVNYLSAQPLFECVLSLSASFLLSGYVACCISPERTRCCCCCCYAMMSYFSPFDSLWSYMNVTRFCVVICICA